MARKERRLRIPTSGGFGISTFRDAGSAYADKVTVMAGSGGNAVGTEQASGVVALPASNVLLLAGTDGGRVNRPWRPVAPAAPDRVSRPGAEAVPASRWRDLALRRWASASIDLGRSSAILSSTRRQLRHACRHPPRIRRRKVTLRRSRRWWCRLLAVACRCLRTDVPHARQNARHEQRRVPRRRALQKGLRETWMEHGLRDEVVHRPHPCCATGHAERRADRRRLACDLRRNAVAEVVLENPPQDLAALVREDDLQEQDAVPPCENDRCAMPR